MPPEHRRRNVRTVTAEVADIAINLHPDDAGDAAELLMGLAALIDPGTDPDGLPADMPPADVQTLLLTPPQLALLHRARYRDVERASVAKELRRISVTIKGQIRQQ